MKYRCMTETIIYLFSEKVLFKRMQFPGTSLSNFNKLYFSKEFKRYINYQVYAFSKAEKVNIIGIYNC